MTKTLVGLVLVASACGGVSMETLALAAEPLETGHEIVEDMQFAIDSGISRGDFISQWPQKAAELRRALSDFEDDLPDGLGEADIEELLAYAEEIGAAGDAFGQAVEATRAFIYDDASEGAISIHMLLATASISMLDDLRDKALNPGPDEDLDEEE